MKYQYAIVALFLALLVFTGCYLPITGRVIDAETNQPIEGAVVLAEWNEEEGLPGLSASSVYKIVEAETDKKGKFFCLARSIRWSIDRTLLFISRAM